MVTLDEKLINGEQKKIEECYAKLGEQYYAAHKDDNNAEFADLIGAVKASEKVIADHKEEVRRAEEEARRAEEEARRAEEEARRLAEEKAAKERRIKELRERELMPCPNCDAEIYYKSLFCNFCGIKIADFETEENSAVAEPVAEEPVTEEPAVEEPAVQEPAVEEPAVEEPVVDEPKFVAPPTKVFASAPQTDEAPSQAADQRLCQNCGTPLEDDCLFCTECGTPVSSMSFTEAPAEKEAEPVLSDSVRFCTECGFKVTDPGAMFCNECGARLLGEVQEKPKQHGGVNTRRCPACGFNTTDPEVMFCIECGTKLL